MSARQRIAVALLTISVGGFAAWKASEGDGPVTMRQDGVQVHHPYVPAKGDVPTIGHGSTRYESGAMVKLDDPPITRARAEQLARNLMEADEKPFRASMPGVKLFPEEYDLYLDFVGQYGMTNWRKPKSPRTKLLEGDYVAACDALLNWRFLDGYDCSTTINGKRNRVCWGVWTRQMERHAKCLDAQEPQQ